MHALVEGIKFGAGIVADNIIRGSGMLLRRGTLAFEHSSYRRLGRLALLPHLVVGAHHTVYDPEIPVDIYELGLVYKIDLSDDGSLVVDMTLTAPNCPMADFILEDVRMKLESIDGVKSVTVNIVFEPEWTQDMMSEEAKLELGLL